MGYCIEQIDCNFMIPAENISGAINAIKNLANQTDLMFGGSYQGGKKVASWFSWVDMTYIDSNDIIEIFNAWNFDARLDVHGNVCDLFFNAEKSGQEDLLFKTIAPFIKNNSYLEFRGEDGSQWRFIFKNGEMFNKTARLVWE